MGATINIQVSQRIGKLPLLRWKQVNYPVININVIHHETNSRQFTFVFPTLETVKIVETDQIEVTHSKVYRYVTIYYLSMGNDIVRPSKKI